MYHHFIKKTLVIALSVAMVGCGTKSIKPAERKPSKLATIVSPTATLTPVVSIKLDQGRGRVKAKDVVDLQVAVVPQGVIAASRGGKVSLFSGSKPVWQLDVGDAITSAVGADRNGQIAVVGTRSGNIIAIDVQTGIKRWSVSLPSASLSPAVIDNHYAVITTNSGITFALDLANGKSVWQHHIQSPNTSIRGMAKPLQLDADTILVGGADGRLHALNRSTGTPVWTRRVGVSVGGSEVGKLRDIDANPVVAGQHLYAVSYSGQLVGFDMSTGRTMFVAPLSSTDTLAVLADAVLGSSTDGDIIAFHRLTGEKIWENSELKYRGLTNPVVIGQNIVVGDKEGVIHILNQQGVIVGRASTKGELTSLQVYNNHLYAQSTDGVVSVWQF